MRFIKVTLKNGKICSLNIAMIGDISEGESGLTNIGHLTHNNGGFNVKESVEEVENMIVVAHNGPKMFVDRLTLALKKK
jgi:hypothetical protein